MTNFPKLWFLRHGQTEWNLERRLQGHLDSPLTDLGVAQAQAQSVLIGPILKTDPSVVVSPLGRAQQTAQIALGGHPYRVDDRLSEIATGSWEGRLRDEITRENVIEGGDLMLYASAPGGEGFEAFKGRIESFLEDLSEPTVVVSHGLLGKVLRGIVCGLHAAQMDALDNLQGCVYLLENNTEKCLRPDVEM